MHIYNLYKKSDELISGFVKINEQYIAFGF